MVIKSCKKERLNTGTHRSTVWTNRKFAGTFCREIIGDVENFKVILDAKTGGFDTSVMRQNPSIQVDDLVVGGNFRTKVSSKINIVKLKGSGNWWVGPKLGTWSSPSVGTGTWHENYVVENASRSPQWYDKNFTGRGKYLGQTKQNGSRYKHYFVKHKSWGQFWAVRQNYRSDGSVSMAPILKMWRKNGLPNDYVSTVKVNVETSGKLKGTIKISQINIPIWKN